MEKGPMIEEAWIYGQPGEPSPQEVSEAEQLLGEFENHDVKEGDFIRAYKDIAEKTKDSSIKFLLQMIISDEEKHHAVIRAMASSLRGSLNWSQPTDALSSLKEVGAERKELLKLTAEFIKHEKQGIKETKKLVKASKGYYRGLFPLLLQTMIHDSQKHVAVLEFLKRKLKEA
jgi:rubrerythrin